MSSGGIPLKAALLDLDDTLLINDMESFSPVYFQALMARMLPHVEQRRFMAALQAGVRAMMANDGSRGTNDRAFETAFFPAIDGDAARIRAVFDSFYADDFPRLQRYTQADPDAPELVRMLRARGWQLALATQPMFPRVAIVERLRWAGLQAEDFDLITSYETMDQCKPRPGYFQQVVQALGRAPQECLMAGDSIDSDLPAKALGFTTFWVDRGRGPAPAPGAADAQGSLRDLMVWIETGGCHGH